jgi:hypothetical protein
VRFSKRRTELLKVFELTVRCDAPKIAPLFFNLETDSAVPMEYYIL